MKNVALALKLLEAGADRNPKNNDGKTPLHIAAEMNNVALARKLLEAGADINPNDKGGNTPLIAAVEYCSQEIGLLLVRRGANLNAQEKHNGFTALHYAIINKLFDIFYELLDAGAFIGVRNNWGVRPIDLAPVHSAKMARAMDELVAKRVAKARSQSQPSGAGNE